METGRQNSFIHCTIGRRCARLRWIKLRARLALSLINSASCYQWRVRATCERSLMNRRLITHTLWYALFRREIKINANLYKVHAPLLTPSKCDGWVSSEDPQRVVVKLFDELTRPNRQRVHFPKGKVKYAARANILPGINSVLIMHGEGWENVKLKLSVRIEI